MSSIIHLPTEETLSQGMTAIKNKISEFVSQIATYFPAVISTQNVEEQMQRTLRQINIGLVKKGAEAATDYSEIIERIQEIQTGIVPKTYTKTVTSESTQIHFSVDSTENLFGITMTRKSVPSGGATYGVRSINMFPPTTTSGYMYGAGLYRTTSGTSTQSIVYTNALSISYPSSIEIGASTIKIGRARNDAPFVPGTYELTCYFNPPETRSLQRSVAVVEELTREEQEGDTR